MRKRCSRIIRSVSKPLSELQHREICTIVLMHLACLLAGDAEMDHLLTVAAFFNLGAAVAFLRNNTELMGKIAIANEITQHMIAQGDPKLPLSEDDRLILDAMTQAIVNYLRLLSCETVFKAAEMVERAITTGENAELLGVRTPPTGGQIAPLAA